jgi:RNA ligase (TIGR02306 family)
MSSFKVEVIRMPKFGRHPNADRLHIVSIFGYCVIFANEEHNFVEGDLVAYIPVDSVVPMTPEWEWLGEQKHHRIRAKKLRGIFSMGLLTRAPEGSQPGDDVAAKLGIVKYEPPEPTFMGGSNEREPGFFPRYTNIEHFRRYPHTIKEGEAVVVTEKIHGCNGRFLWCNHEGDPYEAPRLWVGSHHCVKRPDSRNLWWKMADQYGLREKLKAFPDHIFYGEVYGAIQDLKYGFAKGDTALRIFDVYDVKGGRYLDFENALTMAKAAGLDWVPILYRGPWSEGLKSLADGPSTLADHMREGFVVRPEQERWDPEVGRVILKYVGEDYLLRKGGTEYQ